MPLFLKPFVLIGFLCCVCLSSPTFSEDKTEWTWIEQQILKSLFPVTKIEIVDGGRADEGPVAITTHNLIPALKKFLDDNNNKNNHLSGIVWRSQVIKIIKIENDNYLIFIETFDNSPNSVGGIIGYAIFEIKNDTIQKVKNLEYVDKLEPYAWSRHGKQDGYPISLGPDQLGLVLITGADTEGDDDIFINFYQFDKKNQNLFPILNIVGLADSEGTGEISYSTTKWTIYPNPQNQKNNRYDLVLHIQKITRASDKVAFPRAILGSKEDTFVLEFDGTKYTHKIPKEKLEEYRLKIDAKQVNSNQ